MSDMSMEEDEGEAEMKEDSEIVPLNGAEREPPNPRCFEVPKESKMKAAVRNRQEKKRPMRPSLPAHLPPRRRGHMDSFGSLIGFDDEEEKGLKDTKENDGASGSGKVDDPFDYEDSSSESSGPDTINLHQPYYFHDNNAYKAKLKARQDQHRGLFQGEDPVPLAIDEYESWTMPDHFRKRETFEWTDQLTYRGISMVEDREELLNSEEIPPPPKFLIPDYLKKKRRFHPRDKFGGPRHLVPLVPAAVCVVEENMMLVYDECSLSFYRMHNDFDFTLHAQFDVDFNNLTCLSFAESDRRFSAMGSADGSVRVVKLRTKHLDTDFSAQFDLMEMSGAEESGCIVVAVAFHPHTTELLTVAFYNPFHHEWIVRVFDASRRENKRREDSPGLNGLHCNEDDENGESLRSADENSVRVLSARLGERVTSFMWFVDRPYLLMVFTDSSMRLFDVRQEGYDKLIKTCYHKRQLVSPRVNPVVGSMFAALDLDHVVLYDRQCLVAPIAKIKVPTEALGTGFPNLLRWCPQDNHRVVVHYHESKKAIFLHFNDFPNVSRLDDGISQVNKKLYARRVEGSRLHFPEVHRDHFLAWSDLNILHCQVWARTMPKKWITWNPRRPLRLPRPKKRAMATSQRKLPRSRSMPHICTEDRIGMPMRQEKKFIELSRISPLDFVRDRCVELRSMECERFVRPRRSASDERKKTSTVSSIRSLPGAKDQLNHPARVPKPPPDTRNTFVLHPQGVLQHFTEVYSRGKKRPTEKPASESSDQYRPMLESEKRFLEDNNYRRGFRKGVMLQQTMNEAGPPRPPGNVYCGVTGRDPQVIRARDITFGQAEQNSDDIKSGTIQPPGTANPFDKAALNYAEAFLTGKEAAAEDEDVLFENFVPGGAPETLEDDSLAEDTRHARFWGPKIDRKYESSGDEGDGKTRAKFNTIEKFAKVKSRKLFGTAENGTKKKMEGPYNMSVVEIPMSDPRTFDFIAFSGRVIALGSGNKDEPNPNITHFPQPKIKKPSEKLDPKLASVQGGGADSMLRSAIGENAVLNMLDLFDRGFANAGGEDFKKSFVQSGVEILRETMEDSDGNRFFLEWYERLFRSHHVPDKRSRETKRFLKYEEYSDTSDEDEVAKRIALQAKQQLQLNDPLGTEIHPADMIIVTRKERYDHHVHKKKKDHNNEKRRMCEKHGFDWRNFWPIRDGEREKPLSELITKGHPRRLPNWPKLPKCFADIDSTDSEMEAPKEFEIPPNLPPKARGYNIKKEMMQIAKETREIDIIIDFRARGERPPMRFEYDEDGNMIPPIAATIDQENDEEEFHNSRTLLRRMMERDMMARNLKARLEEMDDLTPEEEQHDKYELFIRDLYLFDHQDTKIRAKLNIPKVPRQPRYTDRRMLTLKGGWMRNYYAQNSDLRQAKRFREQIHKLQLRMAAHKENGKIIEKELAAAEKFGKKLLRKIIRKDARTTYLKYVVGHQFRESICESPYHIGSFLRNYEKIILNFIARRFRTYDDAVHALKRKTKFMNLLKPPKSRYLAPTNGSEAFQWEELYVVEEEGQHEMSTRVWSDESSEEETELEQLDADVAKAEAKERRRRLRDTSCRNSRRESWGSSMMMLPEPTDEKPAEAEADGEESEEEYPFPHPLLREKDMDPLFIPIYKSAFKEREGPFPFIRSVPPIPVDPMGKEPTFNKFAIAKIKKIGKSKDRKKKLKNRRQRKNRRLEKMVDAAKEQELEEPPTVTEWEIIELTEALADKLWITESNARKSGWRSKRDAEAARERNLGLFAASPTHKPKPPACPAPAKNSSFNRFFGGIKQKRISSTPILVQAREAPQIFSNGSIFPPVSVHIFDRFDRDMNPWARRIAPEPCGHRPRQTFLDTAPPPPQPVERPAESVFAKDIFTWPLHEDQILPDNLAFFFPSYVEYHERKRDKQRKKRRKRYLARNFRELYPHLEETLNPTVDNWPRLSRHEKNEAKLRRCASARELRSISPEYRIFTMDDSVSSTPTSTELAFYGVSDYSISHWRHWRSLPEDLEDLSVLWVLRHPAQGSRHEISIADACRVSGQESSDEKFTKHFNLLVEKLTSEALLMNDERTRNHSGGKKSKDSFMTMTAIAEEVAEVAEVALSPRPADKEKAGSVGDKKKRSFGSIFSTSTDDVRASSAQPPVVLPQEHVGREIYVPIRLPTLPSMENLSFSVMEGEPRLASPPPSRKSSGQPGQGKNIPRALRLDGRESPGIPRPSSAEQSPISKEPSFDKERSASSGKSTPTKKKLSRQVTLPETRSHSSPAVTLTVEPNGERSSPLPTPTDDLPMALEDIDRSMGSMETLPIVDNSDNGSVTSLERRDSPSPSSLPPNIRPIKLASIPKSASEPPPSLASPTVSMPFAVGQPGKQITIPERGIGLSAPPPSLSSSFLSPVEPLLLTTAEALAAMGETAIGDMETAETTATDSDTEAANLVVNKTSMSLSPGHTERESPARPEGSPRSSKASSPSLSTLRRANPDLTSEIAFSKGIDVEELKKAVEEATASVNNSPSMTPSTVVTPPVEDEELGRGEEEKVQEEEPKVEEKEEKFDDFWDDLPQPPPEPEPEPEPVRVPCGFVRPWPVPPPPRDPAEIEKERLALELQKKVEAFKQLPLQRDGVDFWGLTDEDIAALIIAEEQKKLDEEAAAAAALLVVETPPPEEPPKKYRTLREFDIGEGGRIVENFYEYEIPFEEQEDEPEENEGSVTPTPTIIEHVSCRKARRLYRLFCKKRDMAITKVVQNEAWEEFIKLCECPVFDNGYGRRHTPFLPHVNEVEGINREVLMRYIDFLQDRRKEEREDFNEVMSDKWLKKYIVFDVPENATEEMKKAIEPMDEDDEDRILLKKPRLPAVIGFSEPVQEVLDAPFKSNPARKEIRSILKPKEEPLSPSMDSIGRNEDEPKVDMTNEELFEQVCLRSTYKENPSDLATLRIPMKSEVMTDTDRIKMTCTLEEPVRDPIYSTRGQPGIIHIASREAFVYKDRLKDTRLFGVYYVMRSPERIAVLRSIGLPDYETGEISELLDQRRANLENPFSILLDAVLMGQGTYVYNFTNRLTDDGWTGKDKAETRLRDEAENLINFYNLFCYWRRIFPEVTTAEREKERANILSKYKTYALFEDHMGFSRAIMAFFVHILYGQRSMFFIDEVVYMERLPMKYRIAFATLFYESSTEWVEALTRLLVGLNPTDIQRFVFTGIGRHPDSMNAIVEFAHLTRDVQFASWLLITGGCLEDHPERTWEPDRKMESEALDARTDTAAEYLELMKEMRCHRAKSCAVHNCKECANQEVAHKEIVYSEATLLCLSSFMSLSKASRKKQISTMWQRFPTAFLYPETDLNALDEQAATIIKHYAAVCKLAQKTPLACLLNNAIEHIVEREEKEEEAEADGGGKIPNKDKTARGVEIGCTFCLLPLSRGKREARRVRKSEKKSKEKAKLEEQKRLGAAGCRRPPSADHEDEEDNEGAENLDRRVRPTSCKACRKLLPGCSVCKGPMYNLRIDDLSKKLEPNYGSLEQTFAYCMSCNHGGHTDHLKQWFSQNNVCAIGGCECLCLMADPPNPYVDNSHEFNRKICTNELPERVKCEFNGKADVDRWDEREEAPARKRLNTCVNEDRVQEMAEERALLLELQTVSAERKQEDEENDRPIKGYFRFRPMGRKTRKTKGFENSTEFIDSASSNDSDLE